MPRRSPSSLHIPPRLVTADPTDHQAVQEAIRLGNGARSTLGHLPYSAYYDAASKGTLLLAYVDDRPVGYALYALARGRVRLTHLCVDPAYRGKGIARHLVERISERHSDHLGIAVHCRQDYDLGPMWARLGFVQHSERPGRNKDGHPIVIWWRDHGHPDLFTPDPDTVLLRAAIDLSILTDLARSEHGNSEAAALLAKHLTGHLQLVRTPALEADLADLHKTLRESCQRHAPPLASAQPDADLASHASGALHAAARRVDSSYPATAHGRRDLEYVANAIACGLNVLISLDERRIRTLRPIAAKHRVRIMQPSEVVTQLNELLQAEAYRPVELQNTTYTTRSLRKETDHDLRPLVTTAGGEPPDNLVRTLKQSAGPRDQRIGTFDGSGRLVALLAPRVTNGVLDVAVARVVDRRPADTLAQQMVFYLRQYARDHGCHVITITDDYPSPHIRQAAISDGFHEIGGHLVGFALAMAGAAPQISDRAVSAARRAGVPEPPRLRPAMPSIVAAEIERVWWPVKILDSELPTYLIPIQQVFSSELLGVPTSLIPRSDHLGLSREHVYYRSPRGPRPVAPARLLWYMSKGGRSVPTPAAIIGCSQLDAVVDGTPEELHSRFQHLGVWNERTIAQAAHDGKAQALRFTNTEIFTNPVSVERFQQLAETHGGSTQPPVGPRRISTELFAAIYQEGLAR